MARGDIFILNSNMLITREMQNHLVAEGWQVHVILDLEVLYKKIEKIKPSLLIFEIIVLTTPLIDFIEAIKRLPMLTVTPYLVVTMRATRNLVVSLLQMGFQEMLVKPFTNKSLLSTIERLVAPNESSLLHLTDEPTSDGFRIVEIYKNLDASNSNQVNNFIEDLIRQDIKQVIFDMHKVSYLDSSGIGILIICKKKIEIAGGAFKISNLSEPIKKILTQLHIETIIDILDIHKEN